MKKVSVIVPCFNTERYIDECIASILRQTYEKFELIIIDDGSTDSTKDRLSKYPHTDKRIKIYTRENHGVSSSRNFGIEQSTGDYIMFVDSDDYISKDAIEKLVYAMESNAVDMAVCGYIYQYKNKQTVVNCLDSIMLNQEEAKSELLKENSIQGYSVNKIYKKSVIVDNNIRFSEEISISEDLLFVFDYINCINDVYVISDSLYYYRMRKGSAVNRSSKCLSVFDVYRRIVSRDPKMKEKLDDICARNTCKFRREAKKNGTISTRYSIKAIMSRKTVSRKTKLLALYYLCVPLCIRETAKRLKAKREGYYE